MPYFNSPPLPRKAGRRHEIWWVSNSLGQTVVKVNDQWRTVVSPSEDFLATCSVVLRGGFVHQISDALAAELTAAGYGANVSAS
jgi:hypothetical protein